MKMGTFMKQRNFSNSKETIERVLLLMLNWWATYTFEHEKSAILIKLCIFLTRINGKHTYLPFAQEMK